MSSTNQSPFYKKAEEKFLIAKTNEERMDALEEMIRECPKHKSSEKMLANLRIRYRKLKEKISKSKNARRGGSKQGIKKEDMQAIIVGKSNSGKSSLLNLLTNVKPAINSVTFATKNPLVGMMNYSNTNIQLIENPAIESDFYNKGITNTADTVLILVDKLEQIKEIENEIGNSRAKRIIVFNKSDLLNEQEKRKIFATLQSKKYNFQIISTETSEGISELKDKIFQSFGKIRIFTKEPGKQKSEKPIIMSPNSTVKDVAEKILHGFSNKVKETKITGPSSKFPNQKVGLQHILKDLDIVEFRTG